MDPKNNERELGRAPDCNFSRWTLHKYATYVWFLAQSRNYNMLLQGRRLHLKSGNTRRHAISCLSFTLPEKVDISFQGGNANIQLGRSTTKSKDSNP